MNMNLFITLFLVLVASYAAIVTGRFLFELLIRRVDHVERPPR
jgi:hypothetical protein